MLETQAQEHPAALPAIDDSFLRDLQLQTTQLANALSAESSLDLVFLVYLRKMARFGFFTFGPITVDVDMVEEVVQRTAPRCSAHGPGEHEYTDDYVRLSRRLMDEVRRSGRRRIDELHFLLAFMRTPEGLPARVFGELGVTPEQVEEFARSRPGAEAARLEKLYSPEEAADYLGVHVQTVRAWIRSGRLPASRLAGQRALRIRASALSSVLEPIDARDEHTLDD